MPRTLDRKAFNRTMGVIIVTLFVVAVLIYVAMQPTIGSPDESRRVVHPAGFSVVLPSGWESTIRQKGINGSFVDAIRCVPLKVIGFGGVFSLTRLDAPPEFPKLQARNYKPTTFRGHTAWETFSEHARTREHTRNFLFEENGSWYELLITRPQLEPITGSPWQPYFDSARTAPTSGPAPAFTPTSLPSQTSQPGH